MCDSGRVAGDVRHRSAAVWHQFEHYDHLADGSKRVRRVGTGLCLQRFSKSTAHAVPESRVVPVKPLLDHEKSDEGDRRGAAKPRIVPYGPGRDI